VRGKLVFLVMYRRDGAEWVATYRMSADADAGAGRGNVVGGWCLLGGWSRMEGGLGREVIGLCGREAGNA
jgi:hypothetical protein